MVCICNVVTLVIFFLQFLNISLKYKDTITTHHMPGIWKLYMDMIGMESRIFSHRSIYSEERSCNIQIKAIAYTVSPVCAKIQHNNLLSKTNNHNYTPSSETNSIIIYIFSSVSPIIQAKGQAYRFPGWLIQYIYPDEIQPIYNWTEQAQEQRPLT